MVTTPNATALRSGNRIPAGKFYVSDIIIATAEHSIIRWAGVLDFRHRVAFLTPMSEPDRSAM
jgi:hypothetical protein